MVFYSFCCRTDAESGASSDTSAESSIAECVLLDELIPASAAGATHLDHDYG